MKSKKILITLLIGICMLICIPVFSYATNEELVIVEEATNQYIIYMKQYLNKEFQFAFSNNKDANHEELVFYNSALDKPEDGANNIAYVNEDSISMFENTTYVWIKVNGEIKVSAREINLQDNITKSELSFVGTISKNIPIILEQKEVVNEVNEEGTKITETIGIVKMNENFEAGKYQLMKRKTSKDTDNLFALAELIEKNEFTDIYTQIKASKEFIELYNEQLKNLEDKEWKDVEEKTIEQPTETENGEQYIIWIKSDNTVDVHFLTSYREYKEEFIKEEIKTKLPYTYDDNTIMIMLGTVIIAIILVVIRIVILKKKEMRK